MLNLFRAVFAPPRDLILLLASGWLGLALASKMAQRRGGNASLLESLVSVVTVAFIAGGRLLFAASHLSAFVQSPLSLVSLNANLFDAWGALVCAGIAAAVVLQRQQMPAGQTLDHLTPLFAAVAVGISLSDLASGAGFGKETSVPWAISLWGASRHPTQIYALLASAAILGITWFRRADAQPGRLFMLWVALTAASRLVIEAFRGDSILIPGGLRLAQIVAWIVLVTALIGMEWLRLPAAEEPASPSEADARRKRTVPDKNRAS